METVLSDIWYMPSNANTPPDSSSLCAAHPCSICWPQLESVGAQCNMDENFIYQNITLRNITIADPQFSYGQGIILGNPNTPMQVKELFLDGVVLTAPLSRTSCSTE